MHISIWLLRRGLALVAGTVAVVGVLIPAPAADAHPFGDPQTVEISVDEDVVVVRWRSGGVDDLTLLAVSLGLLPQDRVMLDGAVFPEESDARILAEAPEFEEYLLDRIAVDGCPGSVESTTDLATDGAVLAFTCDGPAGTAAVTVRTLTDLHEAYRALATGPDGQRAVYDVDHESHDWVLSGSPAGPASDTGRSAALQLGTAGGVVAVGAAGILWARRRRNAAAEESA